MKRFDLSNIQEMTLEQLIDLKNEMDIECDSIKNSIDKAKLSALQGEKSDPDWFYRITAAKRILGRKSQKVQFYLSKIKERRRKGAMDHNSKFREVAKRLLTSEMFYRIENESRDEITALGGKE
jgi:hypothetical protein